MRALVPIIAAAICLVGCKGGPLAKPVTYDASREQAVYAALRKEPIPLPENPPFYKDADEREAYNEGFRRGWDCAISGALLHGTFGTPADLTKELRQAWSTGWVRGTMLGGDRWLAEWKKLGGSVLWIEGPSDTIGQPDGAANRGQPIGSDTNRTSAAAGPGG